MKKIFFTTVLLAVFIIQFYSPLKAQIFSEAPVTLSDKGERLTTFIYVKFKFNNIIEIPKGTKDVDGSSISAKFSSVQKMINDFCKNQQIDLKNLKISKAIPDADDGDTLFTDTNTGEIRKLPNLARVFILRFPRQVSIEEVLTELNKNENVEYAHGPIQMINCATMPNDPYFQNGSQWYLTTIQAPQAWDITTGSALIKVAIIDQTGVELTHSDLQSKIIGGDYNPGGVTGPHGTNVAGFIGSATNNSSGIASLGWNVKLLTYQPIDITTDRSITAQKIKDAADAGANVINLSFQTIKSGFTSCSQSFTMKNSLNLLSIYYYYNWDYSLIRDAITYAVNKNVVVVASAGNDNPPLPNETQPCENVPFPCYPAQYSNVIAVSASQQDNTFVDGWNYGFFVSVNAPGQTNNNVGLWTTDLQNTYTNDGGKTRGTSFSAPQVSALSALIKSLNSSLTPSQIKTILQSTADKVGQYSYTNGRNDYFGYGRINAYAALKYTVEHYGGTFTQNVIVPSGDTWNLQPGVTLTFASGTSLIVNGTLNAVGNSSNNITFTRSGSSGTWAGIQFNSGSGGTVQYCTVSYASTAVNCYNSSPQIKSNIIQYCGDGIYCNYYSSPTIAGNTIKNNSGSGVNCWNYSSPTFNDGYGDANVIRNNSCYGVQARYYSNPNLNKGYYGTGNSVNNNSYQEIDAEFVCTVTARNVWWGSYPPPDAEFYTYGGSTIDRSNPLTSDPYPSRSVIAENGQYSSQQNALQKSMSTSNSDELEVALEKQRDKKYDEAIPLFLQVFKNNTDALIGKYALSKIEECFTQAGKKDYFDYSKRELKPLVKEGTETYVETLELETHQMINAGMYKDAVDNLLTILKKYNLNSYVEKNTLFTLGAFYNMFLGDAKNSDRYFDELKQKYPDDELINQIETIKRLGVVSNGLAQNAELMPAEEMVKPGEGNGSVIISNYPNPFNPTTKISFSLPQKSHVKLKVFDVLGREIQILADGVYEAGKHEVEFNATNLPSGVYFYNITTGSTSNTKKMLLVK